MSEEQPKQETEQTPEPPKKVLHFAITDSLLQAVIDNLAEQPAKKTFNLLTELTNLPRLNLQETK